MQTSSLQNESLSRLEMIKKGTTAGFPIMIGYIPVALTYGVLAGQSGLSNLELTLMSVLVFAGAAQFLAISMAASGAGAIEIITATFVLNFRHFVMSLSFMNRLRKITLRAKVPLSLGLTDETFTMASLHKEESKQPYGAYFYASLMLTAYASWIGGSFLGGFLGDIIPARLSESMGIALYAMFIGLLIPSIRGYYRIFWIAFTAMLVNYICQLFGLSQGWAIVAGTLIGGLSGIWVLDDEEEEL
ncbi:AzlC family ABC transporter permease [Halobacillus sp. Marseille-Q1614]|uniref:AzlC family ABC transporter permease n=1 Tax=Halobacillus sp. Marseille-Q1614 TaxID=2709134 RepID=UPI00156DA3C9|nr:AzlC family ABC transporter permease [Halobacillus sp. Marseille-Q1614]